MNHQELVINLSTLRVTLRFEDAEPAFRALSAVWRCAQQVSYVPTRHEVTYEARLQGDRFRLVVDGGHVRYAALVEDVAPFLEGAIYTDFLRTQLADGLTVLHASCCVWHGQPIIFAGESGAGKSALARACVELGATYFGDEHIVTDGQRIWGLPRAVHMDAHREEQPSPPWHHGADLSSYRCRNGEAEWFRLPLWPIPPELLASEPVSISNGILVAARRTSEDTVSVMNAAQRLRTLEAAHFVAGPALGALALVPQAYELTWSHPGRALHQLLAALT